MDGEGFELTMDLDDGYRFLVDFTQPGVPPLQLDEPEPLGDGDGPKAAKVLAAAVGNCLSARALFCLRRARIDVQGMRTTVSASLSRNEAGRLRVRGIQVHIAPLAASGDARATGVPSG